jgi:hypothetical protein
MLILDSACAALVALNGANGPATFPTPSCRASRMCNHAQCTPNHSQCTPNHSQCTPNHSQCTPNHSQCTPSALLITPSVLPITPSVLPTTPNHSQPFLVQSREVLSRTPASNTVNTSLCRTQSRVHDPQKKQSCRNDI